MSTTFLCHCGGETSVKDSRAGTGMGQSIRRRRECAKCGERVTTYEMKYENAAGIVERAEVIAQKAKILLEAATVVLEELDMLKELTDAHRLIERHRYAGVLRQ